MMHDDGEAAGGATHDALSCGFCSTTLQPADKTAALTGVRYLERELFDDTGHLRRGITAETANDAVALINHLRRALGWLEVDLDGRWRWPALSGHSDATTGRPSSRREARRPGRGSRPGSPEPGVLSA
jgi:hypothetical protein